MPAITPVQLRAAKWIALPLAVAVSGLVVAQASYAAFTSSTDNAANSWTAGSVVLGDDDSGAAMFTETDLQPGAAGSKCIAVTSTGSLESDVKFYADGLTGSGLAGAVDVAVSEGTGGSFDDCTGFAPDGAPIFDGTMADLAADATDFGSGLGSWTAEDGDTRTYKIDWSVDTDADNTTQGGTAGIDFVWEAQSK